MRSTSKEINCVAGEAGWCQFTEYPILSGYKIIAVFAYPNMPAYFLTGGTFVTDVSINVSYRCFVTNSVDRTVITINYLLMKENKVSE